MHYRVRLSEVYENSDGCEVNLTVWLSSTEDVKIAQMMFAHECGACALVDAVKLESWLHNSEPARFNLHNREVALFAREYDFGWADEDTLTMMSQANIWTCDRLATI